ncbi:ABC transporter substrate-binding protein [Erysipelothrix urinaevulpis]|uniref:ABC transporter substrate-binding protein n=1 Tax=Erysipelothrix urinaevulpis TaxID=2683717 RepID=UPI00135B0EB8|nr:ABC transporter substrate-binding protein [Erysipelothrix urinaevulpis]
MKAKKMLLSVLVLMLVLTGCGKKGDDNTSEGEADAGNKVMLYSSLKEAQLDALKKGFEAKYPEIKMDYYAAGTGKVATKMATEAQSGQIATDVVWIGDPSNYVTFKEQGILEPYESKEAEVINEKFKDPDNMYIGARLVVMGLATNKDNVEDANIPKTWKDLLKPEFKDQIVMTDPGESGTTFYLVAGLMNHPDYGLDFFKQLKEQGTELESGTTSAHTKVAANAYKAAIGVDYVTQTLEKDGSRIRFTYPDQDMVVVSSPIALVKDSPNQENGKLLYDFIISKEGQEILASTDTTPIRPDVIKEGSMPIDEIISKSMQVDDSIVAKESAEILKEFDAIFK